VTPFSAITGLTSTPAGEFLAAGGVVMDIDRTVLVQMAVFLLLIVVLSPLLFKPVLRLFEERERRTEGARSDARAMQDKAENLLERYQSKLQEVRISAAGERERLRAEMLQLEAKILEQARQATSQIVEAGRAQIEREATAIRLEIGAYSRVIAQEIGSRILGREVG
jgi:F-type H+-transporting ATPase subunit b